MRLYKEVEINEGSTKKLIRYELDDDRVSAHGAGPELDTMLNIFKAMMEMQPEAAPKSDRDIIDITPPEAASVGLTVTQHGKDKFMVERNGKALHGGWLLNKGEVRDLVHKAIKAEV